MREDIFPISWIIKETEQEEKSSPPSNNGNEKKNNNESYRSYLCKLFSSYTYTHGTVTLHQRKNCFLTSLELSGEGQKSTLMTDLNTIYLRLSLGEKCKDWSHLKVTTVSHWKIKNTRNWNEINELFFFFTSDRHPLPRQESTATMTK